ncbi:MAG: response regulator [Tissierellales bacterium]|jgi:signal transduction histidine kinase|nr:response regulator [Tissierellales bacterium]
MKILIVDDSKLNVMVAKVMIDENLKESIYTAYSAMEAYGILEEEEIDLILLDIHMPEMDGITFLEKIKSEDRFREIAVIMLTSVDTEEEIEKCFEIGAMDYIIKPIKEREYLARVKSALREIKLKKELKTANDKILESQIQLLQQQKLAGIGQLAAGVAHEINNPLGFIISNIETLENYYRDFLNYFNDFRLGKKIDEEDLKYIIEDTEVIFEESKDGLSRIAKIIKELRYFSSIDFQEGYKVLDVNESIESILTLINNKIGDKIVVVKNLHDIDEILALNEKLNQVIMNILFNSIFAINEKEIKEGYIEIKTWSDAEYVFIDIFDDGIGIPKENLDKIFNPFFTTKPIGQGIGLGLSTAYNTIVNLHGGEIFIESKVNVGTKVIIKLPKQGVKKLNES